MTRIELANIMASIEYADTVLPVAYYSFPIGEAPALPYIIYYIPNNNDVIADNTNYAEVDHLIIEAYSQNKDFSLENAIESVLKANQLVYSKASVYITSEQMYQTIYESEVVING